MAKLNKINIHYVIGGLFLVLLVILLTSTMGTEGLQGNLFKSGTSSLNLPSGSGFTTNFSGPKPTFNAPAAPTGGANAIGYCELHTTDLSSNRVLANGDNDLLEFELQARGSDITIQTIGFNTDFTQPISVSQYELIDVNTSRPIAIKPAAKFYPSVTIRDGQRVRWLLRANIPAVQSGDGIKVAFHSKTVQGSCSNGVALNVANGAKNVLNAVVATPHGELNIFAEQNPAADILLEGSTNNPVARYRFHATDEDFMVDTLTIASHGWSSGRTLSSVTDGAGTASAFCVLPGDNYPFYGQVIQIDTVDGPQKHAITSINTISSLCSSPIGMYITTDAATPASTVNSGSAVESLPLAFGLNGGSSGHIYQAKFSYTDANGVNQVAQCSLTNSQCTLSGLNLRVRAGQDEYVTIMADVNSLAQFGQQLSGMRLRLGIKEVGNNSVTQAFRATGLSSGDVDYMEGGMRIHGSENVNEYIVRASKPSFSKTPGLSRTLANGNRMLTAVDITAHGNKPVSIARLSFEITENLPGQNLSNLQLMRNNTILSNVVMYDVTNTPVLLNGSTALTDGSARVNIVFTQEEVIAPGSMQSYRLIADVTGSTGANAEYISTHLISEDQAEANFMFHGGNGNLNTAQIYTSYQQLIETHQFQTGGTMAQMNLPFIFTSVFVPGSTMRFQKASTNQAVYCQVTARTTTSIQTDCPSSWQYNANDRVEYVNSALFQTGYLDFAISIGTTRNLIWSDHSANIHQYPGVAANGGPDYASSFDWTNGYLLDVQAVLHHTLQTP